MTQNITQATDASTGHEERPHDGGQRSEKHAKEYYVAFIDALAIQDLNAIGLSPCQLVSDRIAHAEFALFFVYNNIGRIEDPVRQLLYVHFVHEKGT